jgi:hypothetical protein
VALEGDTVRIEVSDSSLRLPAQRTYGTDATTGRGLRLVEEYSSSWGVDRHAAGKTVWLVLRAASSGDGGLDEDDQDVDLEAVLAVLGGDGDDVPSDRVRVTRGWPVAA